MIPYRAPLIEPFGYQLEAADWLKIRVQALLADVPGVGKTGSAIRACDLVFAKNILVVCPASVRVQWGREFERFSPMDRPMQIVMPGDTPQTSGVVVIFYDAAVQHLALLRSVQWDVLIIDEAHYCFPYGTQVQTKTGSKALGEICEGMSEEYVLCCDLSTNALEYRKVTGRIKTVAYTDLVEVTHEQGKFVCTTDHEIWTDQGYVQAGKLTKSNSVRVLQHNFFGTETRKDDIEVLCEKLRDEEIFLKPKGSERSFKSSDKAQANEEMQMVQDRVFRTRLPVQKTEVLQPEMCCAVAGQPTWSGTSGGGAHALSAEPLAGQKEAGLRIENAREQSDAQPQNEKENDCFFARETLSGRARGKREIGAASDDLDRVDRIDGRVPSEDCGSTTDLRQNPKLIRPRFGLPGEEGRGGTGWEIAQPPTHKRSGQKERSGFISSRVVGVAIQKRRSECESETSSGENTFVYCLEVEKHQNFFADGVLVSNCKARYKVGKKTTGYRTRALYGFGDRFPGLITKATRTWRLTGTPAPNHAGELWTHVKSAGLTTMPYYDWLYHFCNGFDSDHGFRFTSHKNTEELRQILAPFMLRRSKAEVQPDLKEPMFEIITVQRSDAALAPEFKAQIPQLAQADEDLQRALASAEKHEIDVLESSASSLSTLRRFTALSKLPVIAEQIEEDLSNGGIQKLVVFAIHKSCIEWLSHRLKKYNPVTLTGDTPATKRQDNIDKFQSDPTSKIFLGNIDAAGTGVDGLQHVCDEAVFVELGWVPSQNAQAIMRLCRIGQKNPVRARVFSLYGSSDETVQEVLTNKTRELAKIL